MQDFKTVFNAAKGVAQTARDALDAANRALKQNRDETVLATLQAAYNTAQATFDLQEAAARGAKLQFEALRDVIEIGTETREAARIVAADAAVERKANQLADLQAVLEGLEASVTTATAA
jgi:hypothetical protein